MLRALKKTRVLAVLGLVATLGAAGIAVAYFSGSGAGSGNAQVGTSTPLTINATITPGAGGIVPGGNPAGVAFTVNNPGRAASGSIPLLVRRRARSRSRGPIRQG